MDSYMTKYNKILPPDSGDQPCFEFMLQKNYCQVNLDAKMKFMYPSSRNFGVKVLTFPSHADIKSVITVALCDL